MPLTRAEISKRYREKQKLINGELYKEKERKRGNQNYKKLKNEPEEPFIIHKEVNQYESVKEEENKNNDEKQRHIIDLNINKVDETGFIIYKPVNKRINPLNKSYLQPQTVQLYFNTFKKVYKNYTKNDIDEVFQNELLNLLNNKPYNNKLVKDNLIFLKKELIPFIKTLNKNEIQVVYSIITRIKGLSSIVKAIYPYLLEKQMNYQQSRDNITLKDIDKLKYEKISFVKNDVLKILDSDELSLSPYEKLVYALFTLFPVRRPVDYIRMEIISSIPKKEEKKQINERKNYYNNGIFYFNRTKNKEIQSFKIPDELNKIIIDYIKQRNEGALLLNERNKELLIGTFKTHILKVFNKIYGISYSAVELRHYYSTYINNLVKMKQMTIEEHRKICIMMNHSYEENKKYAYLLD